MSDEASYMEFIDRPLYLPIAEGNSTPCDSTAPSFLTTFPAEIRNAIYDILFYVPRGIRMQHGYYNPVLEDQQLREDLATGLPLLSTCRQIYWEAGTILFSNNTWILSRGFAWMEYSMKENARIVETSGAAYLLQMFGTRKVMVKRILLDLDRTCPVPCPIHNPMHPLQNNGGRFTGIERVMEVSNLMAEMAHIPDLKVEFVHPKRQAYHDLHPPNGSGQVDLGLQLDMLNNTLLTLRKDTIGIRKYGRQVQTVHIERDCTQGYVVFYMPNFFVEYKDTFQRPFVISDGGRTFKWAKLERTTPNLTNLVWHIRNAILDDVTFPGDDHQGSRGAEIVWDLDTMTLTGASFVASAICQELRNKYWTTVWHDKNIVVKMSTDQSRTDFEKFRNLKLFTCRRRASPWTAYGDPFWNSDVTLLLKFETPSDVTLEDIRFNIGHLVRVMTDWGGNTKITVSVPRKKDEPRVEASMNLWMSRASVLTALSGAGRRERETYRMTTHPAVWMNGRFEALEVDLEDVAPPWREEGFE
ncbi:uncharacterized protein J4E79_011085 [Alternaria viburni]|uniref:uncharacterized protein n=1 Tax=Alternaria viburni TaxID=566460 RepID=UPI0020C4E7D5|nr:uncharacterized protein J4E79_011085 [Alternaria viburni]KAI4644648.1 hypothetical protein J4E79_011085 [Alternaria viburni]